MDIKNILITGAAGNLGSACVTKFISEGHRVFATVSPGKGLTPQPNLLIYEADLTNEDAVKTVIEKIVSEHKKIHAAILTVGGFAMGSIEATSVENIQKMIALNFYTAYNIVRPLYSHFKNQNNGKMVLIGSRPALEPQGGKASIAYALSKTLVFKLAELINADSKHKTMASVIVPNIIDTPENRRDMPNADFTKWLTPRAIADIIFEIVIGKRSESIIKLYQ